MDAIMMQTPATSPWRPHMCYRLILFLFSMLPLAPTLGAELSGRVIAVPDATRITLQTEQGARLRIKLAGIRYPRNMLRGADVGKRHLHMLLAGRFVTVEVIMHTPGGVILGKVLHGGADVGLQMLQAGLAETDPTALDPAVRQRYREAERKARSREIGYWRTIH
jgi:endonuclease YncB( thermonuclease family)